MKPISVKALQYFAGKVCSVFVSGQLQRAFTDTQFNDYFVGQVDWINEDGIMTTHPITNCKNYYALADVTAICEEQVLYPDDKQQAQIIEQMKQPKDDGEFVNVDLMADLARQAKEMK